MRALVTQAPVVACVLNSTRRSLLEALVGVEEARVSQPQQSSWLKSTLFHKSLLAICFELVVFAFRVSAPFSRGRRVSGLTFLLCGQSNDLAFPHALQAADVSAFEFGNLIFSAREAMV